jgi:hypothetical protein
MTTRRQLLIEKYTELTEQLKEHIDVGILPTLEDVEVNDLVFIFSIYFTDINNIDNTVKELIKIKGVILDDVVIKKVIDIVKPFVVWFHSL